MSVVFPEPPSDDRGYYKVGWIRGEKESEEFFIHWAGWGSEHDNWQDWQPDPLRGADEDDPVARFRERCPAPVGARVVTTKTEGVLKGPARVNALRQFELVDKSRPSAVLPTYTGTVAGYLSATEDGDDVIACIRLGGTKSFLLLPSKDIRKAELAAVKPGGGPLKRSGSGLGTPDAKRHSGGSSFGTGFGSTGPVATGVGGGLFRLGSGSGPSMLGSSTWKYQPGNNAPCAIRLEPILDRKSSHKLECGSVFSVKKTVSSEQCTWLELADGRGWIPVSTPSAGVMCFKVSDTAPARSVRLLRVGVDGVDSAGFKWQYAGPSATWQDYAADASRVVEQHYQESRKEQADAPAMLRSVKSGVFHYSVDFDAMQQKNIDHEMHTVRRIRRVPNATKPGDAVDESKSRERKVSC